MRVGICSGYFHPLTVGHIALFEDARSKCDLIVVIVNNDKQLVFKKRCISSKQEDRMRIVSALRIVDRVYLSIDEDMTVCRSLLRIRSIYPDDLLVFMNGGDRYSYVECPETDVCKDNRILMCFGIGGYDRSD